MNRPMSYLLIGTLVLVLMVVAYTWSMGLVLAGSMMTIVFAIIFIKKRYIDEDRKNAFKDK